MSVLDPWGALWADAVPFKGPRLASCAAYVTTEIQGHHQVCRGGPRTLSVTDANLVFAFVKKHTFFTPILDFWKVNRIELSWWPDFLRFTVYDFQNGEAGEESAVTNGTTNGETTNGEGGGGGGGTLERTEEGKHWSQLLKWAIFIQLQSIYL